MVQLILVKVVVMYGGRLLLGIVVLIVLDDEVRLGWRENRLLVIGLI